MAPKQYQLHPKQRTPHNTTSSMASTVSALTHLVTRNVEARSSPFVIEIRDDIYRLLVKRRYSVYFPFETIIGIRIENMFKKPDMVILRISQAISREAQEILYSESSLRYGMNFGKTLYVGEAPDPTTQAVNRTKKVMFDLTSKTNIPGYYETDDTYRRRTASTCKATIDKLMGTHILRDTCHLEFCAFEPSMIETLSNHILPTLKAFNGFRTILVLIDLEAVFEKRVQREDVKKKGSKGKASARVEKIIQAIKDAMEPTLGPAVTSDGTFRICPKFHPREHVPAILKAQAQKLMLEADRLEQSG